MTPRIRVPMFSVVVAIAAMALWQTVTPGAQSELSRRIAHTDPAAFRPSPAVHGGAGTMAFTALLNRGAVTPEFNFLHRGEIPPGAGIGHHFHNTVEEMFVILDGEAQFTIDGRTALVKGPAGVICRAGHSHAIYNSGTKPVQWVNLNVSLNAGVYDNFDLGDTRVGAALDPIPPFITNNAISPINKKVPVKKTMLINAMAKNALLYTRALSCSYFDKKRKKVVSIPKASTAFNIDA